MISIDKFICEPYEHRGGVSAKVQSGFATASQKTNLIKLKVLLPATFAIGDICETADGGSYIYVKESALHTMAFAKEVFDIENKPCIIVPIKYVEIIDNRR